MPLILLFDGSSVGSSKTLRQCVIFGASFATGRPGLALNSLSKSDSFNIHVHSRRSHQQLPR